MLFLYFLDLHEETPYKGQFSFVEQSKGEFNKGEQPQGQFTQGEKPRQEATFAIDVKGGEMH